MPPSGVSSAMSGIGSPTSARSVIVRSPGFRRTARPRLPPRHGALRPALARARRSPAARRPRASAACAAPGGSRAVGREQPRGDEQPRHQRLVRGERCRQQPRRRPARRSPRRAGLERGPLAQLQEVDDELADRPARRAAAWRRAARRAACARPSRRASRARRRAAWPDRAASRAPRATIAASCARASGGPEHRPRAAQRHVLPGPGVLALVAREAVEADRERALVALRPQPRVDLVERAFGGRHAERGGDALGQAVEIERGGRAGAAPSDSTPISPVNR